MPISCAPRADDPNITDSRMTGNVRAVTRRPSGRRLPSTATHRSLRILVLHLSHVEIHRSARRHRVLDGDILHAYQHALAWIELGDDPPRYLVAGPDRAGNLLELVVMTLEADVLVIHAMALRRSTQRALFEGQGS